jgi:hypothetical protein
MRRKAFFFEKKNQKTFVSLSVLFPEARAKEMKVFCFFSSEKKAFLHVVLIGRSCLDAHTKQYRPLAKAHQRFGRYLQPFTCLLHEKPAESFFAKIADCIHATGLSILLSRPQKIIPNQKATQPNPEHARQTAAQHPINCRVTQAKQQKIGTADNQRTRKQQQEDTAHKCTLNAAPYAPLENRSTAKTRQGKARKAQAHHYAPTRVSSAFSDTEIENSSRQRPSTLKTPSVKYASTNHPLPEPPALNDQNTVPFRQVTRAPGIPHLGGNSSNSRALSPSKSGAGERSPSSFAANGSIFTGLPIIRTPPASTTMCRGPTCGCASASATVLIGPAGTPPASNTASHASAPRVFSTPSINTVNSSTRPRRSSFVRNRASSAQPG